MQGAFKVFVALHALDYASAHIMKFSNLAANAGKNVGKINQQLKLMGGLAAIMIGTATVGAMVHLADESYKAYMEISKLHNELRALGLTSQQISRADRMAFATSMTHPAITQASALHLYKDVYAVLGDEHHASQAMPRMAKFQLAMRAQYGEQGDKYGYDAVRAAELQMGTKFTPEMLDKFLEVYTKVANATGGKVTPQDIHSMMKNMPYGRMAQNPDALAKMAMLNMEMGGGRAGTAFNALDRFLIGHVMQNGGGKEKLERWAQYGLLEDIHRNNKGKIDNFRLKDQEKFQQDKVEWLYTTFAGALQAKGVDPYSTKSIPILAQMAPGTTGASGLISMMMQYIRNQKEKGMYDRAYGIDASAKQYEGSDAGVMDAKVQAWKNLQQTMGTALAPLMKQVNQGFITMCQWMTKFTHDNPEVIRAAVIGIAALGAILTVAGIVVLAMASGVGQLIGFIVIGTAAILEIGVHLTVAWITLKSKIIPAIKTLGTALMGLWNNIVKFVSGIPGLAKNFLNPGQEASGGRRPVPNLRGSSVQTASAAGHSIQIHVNGAQSPQLTAYAIKDVLQDLIHPKTPYSHNSTPGAAHGWA